MTALVVLPGLDGTATLLSAFVEASRSAFTSIEVVAYPRDRALTYSELESFARNALVKHTSFVLLGESFSGPIAIAIAADPPPGLLGVVLSTTFSQSPVPVLSPLAVLTRFAPVTGIPGSVLSWWLLGRWATPPLQSSLQAALRSVAPAVLRSRAASALRANVTASLRAISVPVLYLRATNDRLLSPVAGDRIMAAIDRATIVNISGPHLLLQAAPEPCAKAVAEFSARLGLQQFIQAEPASLFGSTTLLFHRNHSPASALRVGLIQALGR